MPETAHVISLKLVNPDNSSLGWDQIDVIHLYNDVTKDLVALCRVEDTRLTEINWKELILEIERGYYVEMVEYEEEEEEEEEEVEIQEEIAEIEIDKD
jgi:hypothetical protein